MIIALRTWYYGLSVREQWLVGVAGGLTALVLLIFAIILPFMSAIDEAEIAHDEAVKRRGAIEATVEAALASKPANVTVSSADIDQIITQGAAEEGFEILKSTAAAPGQTSFRMDQARAPALFSWLSRLEAQGIEVRSITLRGGPAGTVTVDAVLQKVAI